LITGNLTCSIRIGHENFKKKKCELAAIAWNLEKENSENEQKKRKKWEEPGF
jgi:hypothetical protein